MSSPADFLTLLTEYLDEDISADSLGELEKQLKMSEERRTEFRKAIRLHVLAREVALEGAAMTGPSFAMMKGDPASASSPARFFLGWRTWLNAAAAILLLLGGTWLFQWQGRARHERYDAAWLASVPEVRPQNYPTDSIAFIDASGRRTSISLRQPGSQHSGGEGSTGKGSTGKGSPGLSGTFGGGGNSPDIDTIRTLSSQYDFDFVIPRQLREGWELVGVDQSTTERLRVVYRQAGSLLTVLLWGDSRKDMEPRAYSVGDEQRSFIVLRQKGLGIAVEGWQVDLCDSHALAEQFLSSNSRTH